MNDIVDDRTYLEVWRMNKKGLLNMETSLKPPWYVFLIDYRTLRTDVSPTFINDSTEALHKVLI